jgi:predicted glycosyltransferase
MNLLVTRIPALVYPYLRQREQPIRVSKIKNFLPLKILQDSDLNPNVLGGHIQKMLAAARPSASLPLNLNGAQNTARYLIEWIQAGK